jgi:FkbM family methyltransferase
VRPEAGEVIDLLPDRKAESVAQWLHAHPGTEEARMEIVKDIFKRLVRESGLYVASACRLGIDVELDLARLSFESPLKTIFDVGANFGQTACRFAKAFPLAEIWSFEPVPTSFVRLQKAVNSLSQVRVFNCALGDSQGTIRINLATNAGSNSIRPIKDTKGTVDISIDTLDNICDSKQVDIIDLLKIDVEGFELPVLQGASRRLGSEKIRYVYAECVLAPNAEMPHTSFFDLHNFLNEKGYCFVSYYAESFDLRLGCALGNVLYAFRERLPTAVRGSVRNIS